MSLRSSNQHPPVYMLNAIGFSHESNPARRICNLGAVPLGHVADELIKPSIKYRFICGRGAGTS